MQGVVGVEDGEDHLGAFGARASGCIQPDTRAAANHDDGLSQKLRLASGGGRWVCGGHVSSYG